MDNWICSHFFAQGSFLIYNLLKLSLQENPNLLNIICKLLGCSKDQMKLWLCFRTISTLRETVHKPLSKIEAQYFRDALVKTIYSNLFDWIVEQVNKCLSNDENRNPNKMFKKVNY